MQFIHIVKHKIRNSFKFFTFFTSHSSFFHTFNCMHLYMSYRFFFIILWFQVMIVFLIFSSVHSMKWFKSFIVIYSFRQQQWVAREDYKWKTECAGTMTHCNMIDRMGWDVLQWAEGRGCNLIWWWGIYKYSLTYIFLLHYSVTSPIFFSPLLSYLHLSHHSSPLYTSLTSPILLSPLHSYSHHSSPIFF